MAVFGFCIAADLIFFSCSYTLCTSIWNASSRVSKPKRKPKEFWSKRKSKRKRGEESTEGEPSVHAPEEEEFIATEWARPWMFSGFSTFLLHHDGFMDPP